MTKVEILSEIKRTTSENAGVPLGWRKFASTTGIREPDWKGKFWARWSDAIREAGYEPNMMVTGHERTELLRMFAEVALKLGRIPAEADIRLEVSKGLKFPADKTFRRQFGGKPKLVTSLKEFCQAEPKFHAVIALCDQYIPRHCDDLEEPTDHFKIGFVYLLKHGNRREYKIGRTMNPLRREGEIRIELPERVHPIHIIKTDDPIGIEEYWHKRFADRRKNGEWFELTAADVATFKRRKFM